MADIAELGFKVNSQPVDQAGAKLKNFAKIANDTERKVIQGTNGMSSGFKSFGSSVRASAPIVNNFDTTAKTATKTSGNFANSIRQVSLQLSQVAQQGAVTGDFFRAFTVQLPDLLLPFGTLAILIGAVAGGLGGPLIDALSGSSKAVENLDEDIEDLVDGFENLTDAQKEYILLSSKVRQAALREEFQGISESIADTERELRFLERGIRETAGRRVIKFTADTKEIKEAADELIKLNAARSNIELKLEREAKLQDEVANATKRATQAAREASEVNSLSVALSQLQDVEQALEQSNKTQIEIAIQGASERNSILADAYSKDLINFNEYRSLRAENQLALQTELTEIDKKAQAQRNEILTAGQEAALAASGQLFGNLAAIAKEGGEDQFQEYKNLASAQAAISAALAITNVLATPGIPFPLAVGLSATMGALAAVQIAKIQGQEYQSSRASGGQATGRVLVGENGPEILDMGSRTGVITSAAGTKNELGSGQTIQQIFNISPGIEGTVRAEILNAIPLMKEIAVQAGVNSVRNGGSMARAVGRR